MRSVDGYSPDCSDVGTEQRVCGVAVVATKVKLTRVVSDSFTSSSTCLEKDSSNTSRSSWSAS